MDYKKIIFNLCFSIFLLIGVNSRAQINVDSFAYTGANQTWTVPCATSATVYMWGAGGGGGGGGYLGNFGTWFMNGGAGGGGACVYATIATLVPGQVYTITVGAGGLGGNTSGSNGGNGGTTTFTGLAGTWTASGGTGGTGESNQNCYVTAPGGPGGSTGTGVGITINAGGTGSTGYNGDCANLNSGYTGSGGGAGGSGGAGASPLSGTCVPGGAGGIGTHPGGTGGYNTECGNDIDANGTNGIVPGGGGGGDNSWVSGDLGGNGANGQVVIAWTNAIIPVTASGVVIHNASSCGDTGEIAVHATGVALSYMWTPSGQTTDTATGLLAGTYTVSVTSPCGGSATAVATITQPMNVITATATATGNVLCNGGSNGSATVAVVGGGNPYMYTWTPSGETTATATGLSAGIYTVTVKDFCLATTSATVTITQPTPFSIANNFTAGITCNGDSNASVQALVSNGTSPYNYAWHPYGGNSDSAVGLNAGTYTLSIVDNNGCTGSDAVVITQPNVLIASASVVNNVPCNGKNMGNAMSTTTGGTSPYNYVWTGGETSANASDLTAGSYTVSVTDTHGCTASATTTLTQPPALNVETHTTFDSIGRCTGSAWLVVTGGIYPYTYSWSNGNSTYSLHYVCHDTFCYHVKDNYGCVDSGCVYVPTDLGISNISGGVNKVTIYPNPNNGVFTIQGALELNGTSEIEIYNVLGEKVYSRLTDNNTQQTINLSGQPQGIYLYRVMSSENGTLLGEGKIVINK